MGAIEPKKNGRSFVEPTAIVQMPKADFLLYNRYAIAEAKNQTRRSCKIKIGKGDRKQTAW